MTNAAREMSATGALSDGFRRPEYAPKSQSEVLGHLIEECGEVVASSAEILGHMLNWRLDCRGDPDAMADAIDALDKEMTNLEEGIRLARQAIGDRRVPEHRRNVEVLKETALIRLSRAAGEMLQAVGKSRRHGLDSSNPELPPDQRVTNADWIRSLVPDMVSRLVTVDHELGPKPMDGEAPR